MCSHVTDMLSDPNSMEASRLDRETEKDGSDKFISLKRLCDFQIVENARND